MNTIRSISAALGRMADRMVGQDVERHNTVHGNRAGGDFAAVSNIHANSQGVSPLGLGR